VTDFRKSLIRAGFETLYFSGAHVAFAPLLQGVGAILTLHHVRPPKVSDFQPNRLLEISPDFFVRVIELLRGIGIDIVSLDEMRRRLREGDFRRRFVCLTFDDGYRDVQEWAYPVLQRYRLPFALYIATSFHEKRGEMWWLALEKVIANSPKITVRVDGRERVIQCDTVAQKYAAYQQLYWWLRQHDREDEMRAEIRDLCARYNVDMTSICGELCMDWENIAQLARDPLCTIGAHTVNHVMLAKVPEEAARAEMADSRDRIEAHIGIRPAHFSYPVGGSDAAAGREYALAGKLGFATAVTTRPGVLFPEHGDGLQALPRLSLNGDFQHVRYAKVLLSGTATALWNGFRRIAD